MTVAERKLRAAHRSVQISRMTLEGKAPREIAEVLECNVETVYIHLRKQRKRLAKEALVNTNKMVEDVLGGLLQIAKISASAWQRSKKEPKHCTFLEMQRKCFEDVRKLMSLDGAYDFPVIESDADEDKEDETPTTLDAERSAFTSIYDRLVAASANGSNGSASLN